jgi:hypothetical protein
VACWRKFIAALRASRQSRQDRPAVATALAGGHQANGFPASSPVSRKGRALGCDRSRSPNISSRQVAEVADPIRRRVRTRGIPYGARKRPSPCQRTQVAPRRNSLLVHAARQQQRRLPFGRGSRSTSRSERDHTRGEIVWNLVLHHDASSDGGSRCEEILTPVSVVTTRLVRRDRQALMMVDSISGLRPQRSVPFSR